MHSDTELHASVGLSAKTYIHQLCADTGWSLEDQLGVMDDWDWCWENQGILCYQHNSIIINNIYVLKKKLLWHFWGIKILPVLLLFCLFTELKYIRLFFFFICYFFYYITESNIEFMAVRCYVMASSPYHQSGGLIEKCELKVIFEWN